MKHLAFIFLMVIGLQVQGQEQEGTGIIKANPIRLVRRTVSIWI